MFGKVQQCRKRRKLRFGHAARMASRRSFHTGRPSITGRVTLFARATPSCSIMKARGAARLLSRAKSRVLLQRSNTGCKRNCSSAIWTRSGIGALRLSNVEGVWRILQLGEGDDFVLATGESHTVREFVEAAFGHANLDWRQYVKHDPRYERPAEVDILVGDASKARKTLDWEPKVRFRELVRIMVDADMALLSARDTERTTRQAAVTRLRPSCSVRCPQRISPARQDCALRTAHATARDLPHYEWRRISVSHRMSRHQTWNGGGKWRVHNSDRSAGPYDVV